MSLSVVVFDRTEPFLRVRSSSGTPLTFPRSPPIEVTFDRDVGTSTVKSNISTLKDTVKAISEMKSFKNLTLKYIL